MIGFAADTLRGNNKNAFLRAEIEIECRGKIGQKSWVRPLNRKARRKGTHRLRELPRMPERREFFKSGWNRHARISIPANLGLLAQAHLPHIPLTQPDPDLHSRRVH